MTHKLGRRAASFLGALALVGVSSTSLANGRYPAAGEVALLPGDPQTILVRATYGVLLTKDAGKRWDWICEGAIGFSGSEDPMISFTADGTILAGIFEGLAVSRDHGCGWAFEGGGLANHYVVDLAVDKVDATRGVLVISNNTGQNDAGAPTFIGQLWETLDSGATWKQAGVDLPTEFLALTVDSAPSNPSRVYVSGRMGPPAYEGVLQRSDDRGMTWQKISIPGSDDTHLPYVGAIDPQNPDVVYVRIDAGGADQVLVTKDGGGTWDKIFEGTTVDGGAGDLLGFALSPDGSKVAVGGNLDGIWTAPASTLQFTQVSTIRAKCLTWATSGLYACADEAIDKLTVGLSQDDGKTFQPIMHLSSPCGPLACGDTSSVAVECNKQWPVTAVTIGSLGCNGAGGSSGTGGKGGAGGGTGGAAGAGGGDCSCGVPVEGGGSRAASAALLGLAALALRKVVRRRAR